MKSEAEEMEVETTSTAGNTAVTTVDACSEFILVLCRNDKANLSVKNSVLGEELTKKGIPVATRVAAINSLLSSSKIEMLQSGKELLYRIKAQSSTSKDATPSAASIDGPQEKHVLQVVEESGAKGIWVKEIRYKTNLPQNVVTKVLKSLESKRIIKGVKSVAQTKRKVYMLYDLTPDISVTGGSWYDTDKNFDSEFVDILCKQALAFIHNRAKDANDELLSPLAQREKSSVSIDDVAQFINDSKISKVKLATNDVTMILEALVYDRKIDRAMQGSSVVYRLHEPFIEQSQLTSTPCGICPLIDECRPDGLISPLTCLYLDKWLQF